ncbi:P22AR C-terminal domain-containing protein [Avibacterium sp. 21-599]|uniref:P22AR C-terminal domain-containing protein n=1 Tax=Avibacterium sp. 21-599 TaxID=2911528 RepID=UPI0022458EA9|nr:P22AR C-terminal domain-containing protein [Avibacterium sp. 21-599]MCW9717359.1 KilA-N domain-containing protein [Avibacterium sp. 21-599]
MKNLTILDTQIRTLNNLYSLNDFHKASGGEEKNKPTRFMRLDQTKDLITEIKQEYGRPDLVFSTIHGGINSGTYACKELVIAYAAWISAAFHLKVIRAFMAINGIGTQPQQLALPEPEKKYPFEHSESDLQNLAWDWFALFKCVEFTQNILPALDAIQSKFAPQARGIVSEYGSILRHHQPLIQKLTAQFEVSTWGNENWNRVLPTIRDNAILTPRKRLPRHTF